MAAEIIEFPRERITRELPIGKRRIAMAIGYSQRWVQLACNEPEKIGAKEPMPHYRARNGVLEFILSEVETWLEARERDFKQPEPEPEVKADDRPAQAESERPRGGAAECASASL